MAACSSEIDATVFLRWPRLASPKPDESEAELRRREHLRRDFRRHFGGRKDSSSGTGEPKEEPPVQVKSSHAEKKRQNPIRQQQQPQKPQTKSTTAHPLARDRPSVQREGQPAVSKAATLPAADAAPPSSLRHLRLLSPGTRANRWMHTTWHHMPPHPDTSRGDCRASHFSRAALADCGHYRIHPDWGWDAALPDDAKAS